MQRSTSQRKSLLYMVLAKAATELRQLSAFCPLYTHSVPTLSINHDHDQVEHDDVHDYVVDDDMMTHLDLGSDEVSIEKLPVFDPVKLANLLSGLRVVHLTTLLATLLLERHLWGVVDLYPEIKTSSLRRER